MAEKLSSASTEQQNPNLNKVHASSAGQGQHPREKHEDVAALPVLPVLVTATIGDVVQQQQHGQDGIVAAWQYNCYDRFYGTPDNGSKDTRFKAKGKSNDYGFKGKGFKAKDKDKSMGQWTSQWLAMGDYYDYATSFVYAVGMAAAGIRPDYEYAQADEHYTFQNAYSSFAYSSVMTRHGPPPMPLHAKCLQCNAHALIHVGAACDGYVPIQCHHIKDGSVCENSIPLSKLFNTMESMLC